MGIVKIALLTSAALWMGAVSSQASAQETPKTYDLPEQDLAAALRSVARSSDYQLVADAKSLKGARAPSLAGAYTVEEAVAALLAPSGLTAEVRDRTITLRGREAPSREEVTGATDIQLLVTGSRIRGVTSTSPMMTTTKDEIQMAGLSNLGDFARSLPQSFSGGQNPGVTVGVGGVSNENVSSASSLNLRGLGPDATLTLLNGKRLSYNGVSQAIDISSIPLGALDRIEIITDGASAVYGSDAVAGVANIILKRGFDGMEVSARLGSATDGGDDQRQYSVVAGKTARNAGLLLAYTYDRNTAIKAGQRSFTSGTFPSTTIYPAIRQHNLLGTGYWEATDRLTFSADLLFNHRKSTTIQPLISNDYLDQGYYRTPVNEAWSVSPKIEWKMPADWLATAMATFGEDKIDIDTRMFVAGALNFASIGSYTNRSTNLELNFEGPAVRLPGGDLRLALGGGYRSNRLIADLDVLRVTGTSSALQFSKDRSSSYVFGEAAIPIIGADQEIPFLRSLELSAAARHERYSGGMGHVTTPKLGLIYAPSRDADIKFSWGRSFKTPTLYQQNLDYTAQLLPVSYFGATGYPASATTLFLSGGNPNLRPERATTISGTLDLHPSAVPGLRAAVSLYHITYRNRIASAITSYTGLLTNPAYQSLVNLTPSDDAIGALIAGSPSGLTNLTTAPFNIDDVAAVIDGRYVNIARQTMKGIDLDLNYSFRLAAGDAVSLTGNIAYLESQRMLTPTSGSVPAAGTLYYPPKWRGRAGATWSHGQLSLGLFGNYIGGLKDRRVAPVTSVEGMRTIDLTARYRTGEGDGIMDGIEVSASALNIFNDKPDMIRTAAPFYPAYDSTNYSAVGRFLSITVTKRFQ
ncbi:TonB-dependent receptor [Sphingobium yanoikuyae]|uniref:TonB-dependent receptor n=1 Tax=Sphingobium yanoikuyae TaxID=13690 RepID=UPI00242C95FE|nr:TonB-dependent receptor [Sphingobium yanoikuyae]